MITLSPEEQAVITAMRHTERGRTAILRYAATFHPDKPDPDTLLE